MDYENLSREELLRLLDESNRAKEELQKALEEEHYALEKEREARKKGDEALQAEQIALEASKRKCEGLEKIAGQQRKMMTGLRRFVTGMQRHLFDYEQAVREFDFDFGDYVGEQADEAVREFAENLIKVMESFAGKEAILATLLGNKDERCRKGSAPAPSEKEVKQDAEAILKAKAEIKVRAENSSYENNKSTFGKAIVSNREATITAQAEEKKESLPKDKKEQLEAASEISENGRDLDKRFPRRKPTPKKSKGRCRNSEKLRQTQSEPAEPPTICKDCGHGGLQLVEMTPAQVKTLAVQFNEAADSCVNEKCLLTVTLCPFCRNYHVYVGPNQSFGVLPNRTTGIDIVLAQDKLVLNGMPVHRAGKDSTEKALLGSDTASRNLKDLHTITFKPLYRALREIQSRQRCILVDETPFDCHQDEGRGNLKRGSEIKDAVGQTYVIGTVSGPDEESQIRLYSYSRGRSVEAIGSVLEGYQFRTLASDGYAGYDTLTELRKEDGLGCGHQVCLVHFRREIVRALLPSDLCRKWLNKEGEERITIVYREQILAGANGNALLSVLDGINQIIFIDDLWREARMTYPEARAMQTNVWNNIEKILEKLSESRVELRGRTWVSKKHDEVSKICTYYRNHREGLKYFLKHPDVPTHTNTVESSLRAMTILRKNCYYKTSPDYLQGICISYSIHETLRVNNVPNPEAWLREYSRAIYEHLYSRGLTLMKRENPDASEASFQIKDPKREGDGTGREEYLPKRLLADFDIKPWIDSIFSKESRIPSF